MKLGIIENNGPDNLRDTLKSQLRRVSEVSIAVAFVTQAGLDEIVQPLRQAATNGRVRLLTGLYRKFTEPQALRTLLRIQEQTRGQLSVRLSLEPQFHRKLYLLTSRTYSTAILGSSNLTRDGLRSSGELNLIVRLPKDSTTVREIARAFDDDWEHRAVRFEVEQVALYEKGRPEVPKRESYSNAQLKEILGASPSHQPTSKDCPNRNFWRDYTTTVANRQTQRIISDTTNWDDKNYWWYSTGGVHPYKIRDRIFLFDFFDQDVRLVQVRDIAHTKITTPDGRHFVAYRPLPRAEWHLSKELWTALKGEGINRTNAHKRRKLSAQKADCLKALIRSVKRHKRGRKAY